MLLWARVSDYAVKVAADGPEFAKGLAYWFAIALPATYVNSMVRNNL